VTDIVPEAGDQLRPAGEPVSYEPFDRPERVPVPEADVVVPIEDAAAASDESAVEEPLAAPGPDAVAVALERLDDRIGESQRLLGRQTEIAAALHAENQRLKEGELRKAQQPFVRDVLRVHDDVAQMLAATAADDGAGRDLDIVKSALVDALARNGIEPVACEPGDAFDPRAHKVAGVRPAQDEAADRTIAEVVRPGFAWDDGELLRVAEVAVWKYRPAPETEEATS
jgi:molecular chaperone GrpE